MYFFCMTEDTIHKKDEVATGNASTTRNSAQKYITRFYN
jgi:hypothetical protein